MCLDGRKTSAELFIFGHLDFCCRRRCCDTMSSLLPKSQLREEKKLFCRFSPPVGVLGVARGQGAVALLYDEKKNHLLSYGIS